LALSAFDRKQYVIKKTDGKRMREARAYM